MLGRILAIIGGILFIIATILAWTKGDHTAAIA